MVAKKNDSKETAESMARKQREISVSEFFLKNRHLLGFDNSRKALLTTVKEAVDNALDACEEAGIVPEISVDIQQTGENRFRIAVTDNGPGIVRAQIPRIFAKLLYGSKFHRLRMSRGQQGIGISAAGMYGQLTTGSSTRILSKIKNKRKAYLIEVQIDASKNKPAILKDEETEWKPEFSPAKPDKRKNETADDIPWQTFHRVNKRLPEPPREIKPHPHGVELGLLMQMLKDSKARTLRSALNQDFSRVSSNAALEICKRAGLSPKAKAKSPAKVKRTSRKSTASVPAAGSKAPGAISRKEASRKIMNVSSEIYNDIVKKRKKPNMSFPVRALSNVKYDVKRGHFTIRGKMSTRTLTYNTVKTFAQSMRLMATTKNDLLDKNDIAGKREIYYNSKSWGECRFEQQSESDSLLDDMEAMLGINREQLGYIPEEQGGDVTGPVTVIDQNPATKQTVKIDCQMLGTGAWRIPSRVEHLKFETNAKFVLVIETASLFQRLVHHEFYRKAKCILISMGGVPSRACRRFIRRLSDDRGVPVVVFTDG